MDFINPLNNVHYQGPNTDLNSANLGKITARKILEKMPAPTSPNLLTNNLYAAAPFAVNRSKLDAKLTWTPSSKMTVNGRLGWLKYSMDNPPALCELGGVPTNSTGGRAGHAFGNVYSTTYSLNYVFTPSFVVDAYVGWQSTNTSHDPVRLDEKLGTDFLGIPGTNGPPLAGGWPRFSITNYTDIGTQGNSTALRYKDWQYEIVGNASWTRKSHTIRFGMDMARIALNHYEATSGPGVFNYTGGATALNGGPAPNQFNSFAQFLLGLATSVAKEELPFDDNQVTSRQTTYSFYVYRHAPVENFANPRSKCRSGTRCRLTLLRPAGFCAGHDRDVWHRGLQHIARAVGDQSGFGLVPRLQCDGTMESGIPRRSPEFHQHAAFRFAERQRLEPATECRRDHPQPGWICDHHQHDGRWQRRHRRTGRAVWVAHQLLKGLAQHGQHQLSDADFIGFELGP